MDLLNDVVRNLVILVIVMTFIEMLLPDNKLRSTAKLIFGLMVIATLLNPVVVILNSLGRSSFDFSEFAFGENITYSDDEEVQEFYNQLTLNQYIENIENTVIELIEPHTEGYSTKVEVVVVTDFSSKDFGKLVEINVYLSPEHEGIKPIKPIVIGEDTSIDKYVEHQDSEDITKVIQEYFQISDSIIHIYIEREEG